MNFDTRIQLDIVDVVSPLGAVKLKVMQNFRWSRTLGGTGL